ncbi:MAG: hypothetical protein BWZ02_01788 [Lentisphaerae bacterium ADurb.BinA184]|nr:MAG: hypothetical protein BWZ02_01788 [Lentisphaerae bacterium ADurb.BinA184]
MTATGTPLPVEYCQARLTFSIVKLGAVTATFGSATVIACAQMLLCRMGSSGPGVPSDGTADGSTAGGGMACAAGQLPAIASSAVAVSAPARRRRPAVVIASGPR